MLKFTDLTVRMAGRTLIENAEISIPKGVKAGLVGANGTGKTTLFKVITGLHPSDTGSITISKDWKMGQVAQEAPGTEESLLEIVLKADEERASLMEEAETATDPTRISDIHMRLADIDAYTADSRASSILAGLGFSERDQHSPASFGLRTIWANIRARFSSSATTATCSTRLLIPLSILRAAS